MFSATPNPPAIVTAPVVESVLKGGGTLASGLMDYARRLTGGRGANDGSGNSPATSGTANRGAGGGGGGGQGGSGIVIVRYSGSQSAGGGTYASSGGYSIHTFTGDGTFSVNSVAYFIN